LEVEAVVREACEQVLTDPSVPREKLVLRATALELAAEAFLGIKKESSESIEEFVKVETPSSKPPPPPAPAPSVPPRPTPASTRPGAAPAEGEGEKQETLHAAYKACECL
jgi:hypothetical protein